MVCKEGVDEWFIFECYVDRKPKGDIYGPYNSFMEAATAFSDAVEDFP